MPITYTPLRYPGGKTKLYDTVKRIIDINDLHGTYIEPFAGGAGLALKLLINGDVKKIVINDSDPAIYAFWYCALNDTEKLCHFIKTVSINIETWEKMREIYLEKNSNNLLELAEATFFLNRVNRSGVIKGGVIGGKDQTGIYKMDARFNRDDLIRKIKLIETYKEQIDVYNLDVLDFLSPQILRHYYKVFINFDPPYVSKGGQLYMNFFTEDDHKMLAQQIGKLTRKWMVTYDKCSLIRELYGQYRGGLIDITYTANHRGTTQEYIFFSDDIVIPEDIEIEIE
ncbi:MAG: DNA adenine methylase [Eubacteriales bacterium]|nr:DNA adenine methylase [Eubacteriales bacterium]